MVKQSSKGRKEPYHFVAIEEEGKVVFRESFTLKKNNYNGPYISVRTKGDKEKLCSLIELRNKNRTDYRAFREALENSDFETESGEKYFDEEKERYSFLDRAVEILEELRRKDPELPLYEEVIREMQREAEEDPNWKERLKKNKIDQEDLYDKRN